MSRVITFSRTFPKGHPKEGEPTYFVEKMYNSLAELYPEMIVPELCIKLSISAIASKESKLWRWIEY